MLYKVWAQNCVRPKGMRINKATVEDLNKVFNDIYNAACNENLIDDITEEGNINQEELEKHYKMIEDYWEKNKTISAGDYMIVDVESQDDITIPNMCGADTSFIF